MPAPLQSEKVRPEKVLRDLRDLWTQLGSDQKESGGVLRACAMTLLVVAENEDAAQGVRRTLGGVMHDHPCRAIVLRLSPGAEMEARVFAECWLPSGSQKQICAEGIELTSDAAHLDEAAQLMLPLIVPDLPVVLWLHGGIAFAPNPGANPLLKLAQKVIVDSGSAADAASGLAAVRALRSPTRRVADLAWTRLTGWRESLANAFTCNRSLAIASVRIQHAGAASTSVLYFERWMKRAIPSAAIKLEQAKLEPVTGGEGLRAVILSGQGDAVTVALSGEEAIEMRVGDKHARTLLPSTSDEALLREELSIPDADPVYDGVLEAMSESSKG
jgi:glucose-6-phosphate dehydrogenase assembly protein OpcA